jgi:solute carrier family 35 protein
MPKQVEAAGEEESLLARRSSVEDIEQASGRAESEREVLAAEKSRRAGLLAALLYGSTSVTITFFNKAVFFVWHFDFPVTITLLQVCLSLVMFLCLHLQGAITLPALSLRMLGNSAPLAIFWCLNVLSGIFTLQYMSIPMFSTLRRLTTLFVLMGEHFFLRRYASQAVWASVLIMSSGALVAGVSDLDYNPMGYICVTINNVCTGAYLLLIQVAKRDLQVSNLQLLFLMNLCSLPFLALTAVFFDAQLVWNYEHLGNSRFLSVLFASCVQVRAP